MSVDTMDLTVKVEDSELAEFMRMLGESATRTHSESNSSTPSPVSASDSLGPGVDNLLVMSPEFLTLLGWRLEAWTCFTCWTEMEAFETHWLEDCAKAAEAQIRRTIDNHYSCPAYTCQLSDAKKERIINHLTTEHCTGPPWSCN